MNASPPLLKPRKPAPRTHSRRSVAGSNEMERSRFLLAVVLAFAVHAALYWTSQKADVTQATLLISDEPPSMTVELVAGAEPEAMAEPVDTPPEPKPVPVPEPMPEPMPTPEPPPEPEPEPEPTPEPPAEEMTRPEPKPEPKPTPRPIPPRPRAVAPRAVVKPATATGARATAPAGVPGGTARAGGGKTSDARATFAPEPLYPGESQRAGETGTVKLRMTVDVSGRPTELSVHQSSGFSRLDRAAVEGARRWRFKPAMQNGVPVQSVVILPVVYRPRR